MKHRPVKLYKLFSIEAQKIERKRRYCPRCGDSFLAKHSNRFTCGKCGYSEIPKS